MGNDGERGRIARITLCEALEEYMRAHGIVRISVTAPRKMTEYEFGQYGYLWEAEYGESRVAGPKVARGCV